MRARLPDAGGALEAEMRVIGQEAACPEAEWAPYTNPFIRGWLLGRRAGLPARVKFAERTGAFAGDSPGIKHGEIVGFQGVCELRGDLLERYSGECRSMSLPQI